MAQRSLVSSCSFPGVPISVWVPLPCTSPKPEPWFIPDPILASRHPLLTSSLDLHLCPEVSKGSEVISQKSSLLAFSGKLCSLLPPLMEEGPAATLSERCLVGLCSISSTSDCSSSAWCSFGLVTHDQLAPQLSQLNALTLRFLWPTLTDPEYPKLTFKDSDPPQLLVSINED